MANDSSTSLIQNKKRRNQSAPLLKKCEICGEIKKLQSYGFRFFRRAAFAQYLPICSRCYSRIVMLKKFGLSDKDYEEMLRKANYKCQICRSPVSRGKVKTLVMDHCHVTNKVRGILCNQCNSGIGLFKESATMLRLAIDYLREYKND